ncbi:MAG: transglycosylase domain-containing protein [Candidatus Dormibacteraceae bacterium]
MGSVLLACVIVVAALFGYTLWTLRDIPNPGDDPAFASPIKVLDRNGNLIGTIDQGGAVDYQSLTLAQMGPLAPEATLAAEDRTFYKHGALDYTAILRAAWHDLTTRTYLEGGSTITQQVVTISVLNKADRTPLRKMQEAILATAMEQKYSKSQILDMYMNRVFYGHNAYGIGAAAKIFFGVPANQLTIAQAALLAAILNGPAEFDPVLNYPGARARQLYVLQGMVTMGTITPAQEKQAEAENVQAELKLSSAPAQQTSAAPMFLNYVYQQLEKDFGANFVQQGGLTVTTTLDLNLQNQANQAVQRGVPALSGYNVNNGALVAADPKTGQILAYVGSVNYQDASIDGQYDLAQAQQQPGSSFKVYVYEAALVDHKITLASQIADKPYNYPGDGGPLLDWDDAYEGNITVRQALVRSRNIPAVEIGQLEGMQNVINLAYKMGVTTTAGGKPLSPVPSAAIGTNTITMLENLQGYQTIANQGTKVPLSTIVKVQTAGGTGYTPAGQAAQQVVAPADAYLVDSILKGYDAEWGLGWNRTMAGKSGTPAMSSTNGSVQFPSGWMMAWNPNIVIASMGLHTTNTPTATYTSAYGTDVGSTITRDFINSLPQSYSGWYTQPSGLTMGGNCPGVAPDLTLPGVSPSGCVQTGSGPGPRTTPTPAPPPTATPTPQPTPPPTPTPTPTPAPTPEPTPTKPGSAP